jgi:crotonobetainyl-CoA:carnitine CoA-transferase CaiB-like acyl-CoA transferase
MRVDLRSTAARGAWMTAPGQIDAGGLRAVNPAIVYTVISGFGI